MNGSETDEQANRQEQTKPDTAKSRERSDKKSRNEEDETVRDRAGAEYGGRFLPRVTWGEMKRCGMFISQG